MYCYLGLLVQSQSRPPLPSEFSPSPPSLPAPAFLFPCVVSPSSSDHYVVDSGATEQLQCLLHLYHCHWQNVFALALRCPPSVDGLSHELDRFWRNLAPMQRALLSLLEVQRLLLLCDQIALEALAATLLNAAITVDVRLLEFAGELLRSLTGSMLALDPALVPAPLHEQRSRLLHSRLRALYTSITRRLLLTAITGYFSTPIIASAMLADWRKVQVEGRLPERIRLTCPPPLQTPHWIDGLLRDFDLLLSSPLPLQHWFFWVKNIAAAFFAASLAVSDVKSFWSGFSAQVLVELLLTGATDHVYHFGALHLFLEEVLFFLCSSWETAAVASATASSGAG